ncbi:unnamed protein product [Calicophoron daubneyi]|uniref:Uncharacterized protein n=1 Tax=Calicophoron daubneyi TaxID=300641 RepID=A0AAV2T9Y8_CALDB
MHSELFDLIRRRRHVWHYYQRSSRRKNLNLQRRRFLGRGCLSDRPSVCSSPRRASIRLITPDATASHLSSRTPGTKAKDEYYGRLREQSSRRLIRGKTKPRLAISDSPPLLEYPSSYSGKKDDLPAENDQKTKHLSPGTAHLESPSLLSSLSPTSRSVSLSSEVGTSSIRPFNLKLVLGLGGNLQDMVRRLKLLSPSSPLDLSDYRASSLVCSPNYYHRHSDFMLRRSSIVHLQHMSCR